MRAWIRTVLRWLDAKLIGDDETFPVFRSTDGDIVSTPHGPSGTMQILFSNVIQTGPPAHVTVGERFRIMAFTASQDECCEDCGQATYWLDLQFRSPMNDTWRPLLMMPEMKLSVMADAMEDMRRFLETSDRVSFATP